MSQLPGGAASAPPNIIYIIRHGEKPADPPAVAAGQTPPAPGPPFGVDFQGNQNPHSLLPRGWQRSGALAALFDPATGPLPAGLQIPGALLSPSYGNPDKTAGHRTYQTIQGLSDRLGLAIVSGYAEGDEPQLTSYVVSAYSGVVLICWEHHHIPALASSLPGRRGNVDPADLARRPLRRNLGLHAGLRGPRARGPRARGPRARGPVRLRPDPAATAFRRRRHHHPGLTAAPSAVTPEPR